jgi:hypothetical protein
MEAQGVTMRSIPRKARGRRNQFYGADGVDELLSCVLRLMAEVATVRERQYVTERVLAARGLDVGGEVEAWQPTVRDAEWLQAERERLIATVLAQLHAEPERPGAVQAAPPARSQRSRA